MKENIDRTNILIDTDKSRTEEGRSERTQLNEGTKFDSESHGNEIEEEKRTSNACQNI